MIGSYLIWRGVSFYAGGFPNEFELSQMLGSGAWSSVPWTFYIYLGLMVATCVGGIFYQGHQWKLESPNNKHPYHYL